MFYIYVLRSLKNGKKYTGFSQKLPEQRLLEHNSGTNKYTRRNRPFTLLYSESFINEDLARKREKFLKSGKGREILSKLFLK